MKFTGSLAKASLSTAEMRPFSMRKSDVRLSLARRRQLNGASSVSRVGQRLELLHLERRAHDAGQLAHFLGDQEIVLHEALDRAQPGVPAIAEPLGHGLLHVEAEPLLGPVGEEVQVAAHRPQEALAAAEAPIFVRA